jgi:hypothetical protein
MKDPSKRQQMAIDKRRTARHEAAHYVVAIVKGRSAWAHIELTHTSDWLAEKTWTGQCHMAGTDFEPAIAVAGLVSEWMEKDPEPHPGDIA